VPAAEEAVAERRVRERQRVPALALAMMQAQV
jgi:hypothetical protein